MNIFRDVEIYYFKDLDIYKVFSSCILLRLTTEHMNMILNMWHQLFITLYGIFQITFGRLLNFPIAILFHCTQYE